MMNSSYIVNVSEVDFEYEVVTYSQQAPVVVDFWAEWCGPCKMLGPILEKLADEGQGNFRLAKVDVDANPNLARQFNVRGIPAVKAFRDGKVVAEFTGALPEPRVREFIRGLAPSASDLTLEKAQSLLAERQWKSAEGLFREVLEENTVFPPALLGLAKSLIGQGSGEEAKFVLQNFPASKEFSTAELLLPLAKALAETESQAPSESSGMEEDLEAAFYQALRLIRRGNYPAAMDGLLDILRQDKRYRDGEVRKVLLGVFELLGDDPLTRQYRSELTMVLF